MCNEKLSALALLYIHIEIDPDLHSILEKFTALGPHQLELFVLLYLDLLLFLLVETGLMLQRFRLFCKS